MTSYAIIREDDSVEHAFSVDSARPEIEALKYLFDMAPPIMVGKPEYFTIVELERSHPDIHCTRLGKFLVDSLGTIENAQFSWDSPEWKKELRENEKNG